MADLYIAVWAEDFQGLLTQAALAFNAQRTENALLSGVERKVEMRLSAPFRRGPSLCMASGVVLSF